MLVRLLVSVGTELLGELLDEADGDDFALGRADLAGASDVPPFSCGASLEVAVGVGVGDCEAFEELPKPTEVRWPPPSLPPVYVETERPVSSSNPRMTSIVTTKIAPATMEIHFQGSCGRISRKDWRPGSSGFSCDLDLAGGAARAPAVHLGDGRGLGGGHAFAADAQRVRVDGRARGGDQAAQRRRR